MRVLIIQTQFEQAASKDDLSTTAELYHPISKLLLHEFLPRMEQSKMTTGEDIELTVSTMIPVT